MSFIDYVVEYFRGPQGEQGEQGDPGPAGETGATGAAGASTDWSDVQLIIPSTQEGVGPTGATPYTVVISVGPAYKIIGCHYTLTATPDVDNNIIIYKQGPNEDNDYEITLTTNVYVNVDAKVVVVPA